MRTYFLAAALCGTALTLSACGDTTDESSADATMTDAETPAADAMTGEASTILDANSATAEQLAGAEGVPAALAEAIVAGRPYASATAFNAMLLETVSEAEAEEIRTSVFVPINLNSASEEDIALIPGMTDRMIGEFLEYRPYEDMAEFDREIGKYVDEAEVARLRSYVTL
ncbi:hypothetical protein [Qipengyuania sp. JC766]|uniref:hypothetical protein n=1 Tax=Qipengyuania sp. JC766 TaxID=3232139 RepID=UPI0034582E6A